MGGRGRDPLLRFGIAGTAVSALCALTPLPDRVLDALGLGAAQATFDNLALTALLFFSGMAVYAWIRRQYDDRDG